MDQNKKYLIFLALGLVFILLGGFLWTWITSPMLVTVTGTGEVSVPAGAATITFTLADNSSDAGSAINLVKSKVQNIRGILTLAGIAEADIVESQIRVLPASTLVEGASGYQASISMGAKTTQFSEVENLIATLYANGASLVSQPLITAEEMTQLEDQAWDQALKEAKQEASMIARKNFKFIRKIVSVAQVPMPASSTVTSKADVLTETESPQTASSGIFKIRKTLIVSYKMW